MQHNADHKTNIDCPVESASLTDAASPERVASIMKELDGLAEILAAIGEEAGATNVRLALEHLEKLRSDIK